MGCADDLSLRIESVKISRSFVSAHDPVALKPFFTDLVGQEIGAELDLAGHTVVKTKKDLEVVVHLKVDDVAKICKYRCDFCAFHHKQHLVDKMNAPVEQHAAAFADIHMPVMHISVEAVETALYRVHIADAACIVDGLHGAEVFVKSSLMVNGKFDAALFADLSHIIEFFDGHGDRLLADDVFSGFCGLDHQIVMLIVVHDDQHDIDVLIGQKRLVGSVTFDAGLDILELFGIFVGDTDDLILLHAAQHGLVLMAHKSMTDDSYADFFHVLFLL